MNESPTTTLEQMESRISELELKFGRAVPPSSAGQLSSRSEADVNSRIEKFMRTASPCGVKAESSKRTALREEFRTIDRLLSELALSPLAGNTASGAAAPPIVFRRMQILAAGESIKRDMELLARIRDLTLVGTVASSNTVQEGGTADASSISRVVNCPIISSERYNLPSDPEVAERLERLCFRVAKLNKQSALISQRADSYLDSYGKIMMALSEKMVLAEESKNSA